jgi:hypothetical protein
MLEQLFLGANHSNAVTVPLVQAVRSGHFAGLATGITSRVATGSLLSLAKGNRSEFATAADAREYSPTDKGVVELAQVGAESGADAVCGYRIASPQFPLPCLL